MPVEMDVASEYRYRNPVVGPGDLVIGISQSGETADTLAAMRLARERGATVLAITNVMGSQATRDADGVLYTRAGLEIGVAATKTFVCQVAAMYLLGAAPRRAARDARAGAPDASSSASSSTCRTRIAELIEHRRRAEVEAIAEAHYQAGLLPLPRAPRRPAGRARGRAEAQGDLLHRDRRLRGRRDEARADRAARRATPVVCVATDSPVLDKVVSNMQEVRARGAHVIAIATEGNDEIAAHAEQVDRDPARPTGCCSRCWR